MDEIKTLNAYQLFKQFYNILSKYTSADIPTNVIKVEESDNRHKIIITTENE